MGNSLCHSVHWNPWNAFMECAPVGCSTNSIRMGGHSPFIHLQKRVDLAGGFWIVVLPLSKPGSDLPPAGDLRHRGSDRLASEKFACGHPPDSRSFLLCPD